VRARERREMISKTEKEKIRKEMENKKQKGSGKG